VSQSKAELYAITYAPSDDVQGVFFLNEETARNSLPVLQADMADDENDLSIEALQLEQMTLSFPDTTEKLLTLLNDGPLSFIETRHVLDIDYLQKAAGYY